MALLFFDTFLRILECSVPLAFLDLFELDIYKPVKAVLRVHLHLFCLIKYFG